MSKILNRSLVLGLIQLTNLLVPVLAIPIILGRAGEEVYSKYAVWITFSQFSIIFLDLGYSIFGVQTCSKNDCRKAIDQTITTSTIMKVLASIAIMLAASIFSFVNELDIVNGVIVTGYTLFASIQPLFYFLATGRLKVQLYAVIISKSFFIISLFLLPNITLQILLSCLMASSIISFYVTLNIWRPFVSVKSFSVENLRSALPFMSSRISIAALMQGSILLMFSVTSVEAFAYIAFADQLYRIAISATTPITQVLLPAMAQGMKLREYFMLNFIILLFLIISVTLVLSNLDYIVSMIGFKQSIGSFVGIHDAFLVYGFLVVINFLSRTFGYPLHINGEAMRKINHINILGLLLYAIIIGACYFCFRIDFMIVLFAFLVAEISILSLRVFLFWESYR